MCSRLPKRQCVDNDKCLFRTGKRCAVDKSKLSDCDRTTVKSLKTEASRRKIQGRSKMRKQELCNALGKDSRKPASRPKRKREDDDDATSKRVKVVSQKRKRDDSDSRTVKRLRKTPSHKRKRADDDNHSKKRKMV
jgi:hypothetical protein